MENTVTTKAVNIILVLIISLMSLVLIYTSINWEIFFVSKNYLIAHYIIPFAIIVTCSTSFIFNNEIKLQIALAFVSCGICLFLIEIYLGFQQPVQTKWQQKISIARDFAIKNDRNFDDRYLSEVVNDLRKSNVDAYPLLSTTNYLMDKSFLNEQNEFVVPAIYENKINNLPLSNISNVSSVYCNESGEYLIIDTDRYGFNNPDYVWEPNDSSIVILGDSFAQGACVKYGYGASDKIRKEYSKTINLGMGGTGPLLQLAILKEYTQMNKPKVVLWFFYEGNDMSINMGIEEKSPDLLKYFEPGFNNNLMGKSELIDRFLREYSDKNFEKLKKSEVEIVKKEVNWKHRLKLIKIREKLNLTSCFVRNLNFDLFKKTLAEGDRYVKSIGGELYFVYLPGWINCDLYDITYNNDTWFHKKIIDIVDELNVPVVDMYSEFRKTNDPSKFFHYSYSHYNITGYKLVSDKIIKFLKEKK